MVVVDVEVDVVDSRNRALQLVRAGSGRWTATDAAYRYTIARGEAMESAASLDVMRLRKLLTDDQYEQGSRLIDAVVAMLSKMM